MKDYIRVRPVDGAQVTMMALDSGYAMVRRKGRAPFVVTLKEWESWPLFGSSPPTNP